MTQIKLFNSQHQITIEDSVNEWLSENSHLNIKEVKYQVGGEYNYKPYHHVIIVFE